MEENNENVTLHGMWASPWVRRVTIALKIKRIPYDYIEENMKNKSELLLRYNSVKTLVPVLIHDGHPIPESLIILEYIDEIWNTSPRLFPRENPKLLAKVRFWAHFIDLQLFENLRDVVKATNDEQQEKIVKEIQENMSKLEANVEELYSENKELKGESMEILDILMSTLLPIIKGVEEAIDVEFIHPEKYPKTFSWMKSFDTLQIVSETAPNHENLVNYLKKVRQFFRRSVL